MIPKQLWIFIGVALLLGLGFLVYGFFQTTRSPASQSVMCTEEAKICPDGSVVGRIGLYCNFAACPASQASSTQVSGTIRSTIGVPIRGYGLTITPKKVIEDSRCPIDVTCIQAGTVRLEATISAEGSISDTYIFILGNPVVFEGKSITLRQVIPVKTVQSSIAPSEYRFDFEISTPDGLFDTKG